MPGPNHSFSSAMLAEHSVESLYALHGSQRLWIYWLSLLAVSVALGILPLVPVEITVRTSGILRPATDRIELKTASGGRVARVLAQDNDRVAADQPLVELWAVDLDERLARNRALQREKSGEVADLIELTKQRHPVNQAADTIPELPDPSATLKTPVLIREYAQFVAQYAVNRISAVNAQRIQIRTLALAGKGIVTDGEREDARYGADRASADLQLLIQRTLAGWQTQLHEAEIGLGQFASEERRLQEERALAIVRAPVAGTVQGLVGLGVGAIVTAGQSFGAVSPDVSLLVETFVSPKDIGFLHLGQVVRLQIDAYPYTQWGMLGGVVKGIGADAVINGQNAAFKVLVRPLAPALYLRSGATGTIRKGMTLTARFVVGRRSLLQVLYQDASAWLGPQDRPSSS